MPERVICLIDGDHHPAAVREALDRVAAESEIAAVLFCGGREKLTPGVLDDPARHFGRPVEVAPEDAFDTLAGLAAAGTADAVVDLADEPVVGAAEKLRLACAALHHGLSFRTPGGELRPPPLAPGPAAPSLAVIGTGKRCGKTAVGAHVARLLRDAGMSPVVVSMGRGGPEEPQLAEPGTGLARLLELTRQGSHAASDYLEDAALAGVPTVGCRRVGGGLAGEPAHTNFAAGIELALAQDPGMVIFEGSGATIPPVETDRTICVAGGREQALGELGPLRLMRAQMVLAMHDGAHQAREYERYAAGPVVPCRLAPEPVEPVGGEARVAYFATHSEARLVPEPVLTSPNLARRAELEADLDRAEREGCDTYAIEIKAAAIDTVAERAEQAGARVVFVANRPQPLDAGFDLDAALLDLARQAGANRSPA